MPENSAWKVKDLVKGLLLQKFKVIYQDYQKLQEEKGPDAEVDLPQPFEIFTLPNHTETNGPANLVLMQTTAVVPFTVSHLFHRQRQIFICNLVNGRVE